MSLKSAPIQPIPDETARVARAAFRKGSPLLELRDELGAVFADADFADLFSKRGQPGLPPWRLALITILQFRENLPDRRAAEAVRARIDWKYLLGLELTDPGFDHSVLCEFRARLLEGSAEERLLHKLLDACHARGLLKARGRQRTDATHVLASIRVLNRLELLGETLRAALNELAIVLGHRTDTMIGGSASSHRRKAMPPETRHRWPLHAPGAPPEALGLRMGALDERPALAAGYALLLSVPRRGRRQP
jgi:transposase